MAASDMSDMDRCKRYLKYALDKQNYKTLGSCCTTMNSLFVKNLIDDNRGKDILSEIENLYNDGTYTQLDVLIFVTALCSKSANVEVKKEAYRIFKKICSTPRLMFTFLEFVHTLSGPARGWGRSLKRALSEWYNEKPLMELAEKVTQQKTFKGWSHLDVLRLSHMKATNEDSGLILKFLAKGLEETKKEYEKDDMKESHKAALIYLTAVESAKHSSDVKLVAELVKKHKLCIEHIPTILLKNKEVWHSLLSHIKLKKVLGYFGTLADIGFLDQGTDDSKLIVKMLNDETLIKSGKVKPLLVLNARSLYEKGRGDKPPSWTKNPEIMKALDQAFNISVKNNLKPSKKRFLLCIDIDNTQNSVNVRGSHTMSNIVAAAGVAMALLKVETNVEIVFCSNEVQPMNIQSSSSLDDILNELGLQIAKSSVLRMAITEEPSEYVLSGVKLSGYDQKSFFDSLVSTLSSVTSICNVDKSFVLTRELESGNSQMMSDEFFIFWKFPEFDPTLPINYALNRKKAVDVFVYMSDSRISSHGGKSPHEVLLEYRRQMDISCAKLLSCGFVCSDITAADANDKGMLNICGYNTEVLDVIQMFACQSD